MPKYQNPNRMDDADDEKSYSEELAESQQAAEATAGADKSDWEKRYGDLRRHMQDRGHQHQDDVARLQKQLDEATKQQLKFPKTAEEIEAWRKKYPEVAAIVETIAGMKATEAQEAAAERLARLEQKAADTSKQTAYQKLLSLHPDFEDLKADSAFHEWVETQARWVQDALYRNSTDPQAAADAIDLYKARTGKAKAKPKQDNREAARGVSGGRTSSPSGEGQKKYSESAVQRMTIDEYEKHEDAILKAMRDGSFEYDLTGAAR